LRELADTWTVPPPLQAVADALVLVLVDVVGKHVNRTKIAQNQHNNNNTTDSAGSSY
jgi:hypothetical protein